MITNEDYMHLEVQKRPRMGNYAWIAKAKYYGTDMAIILYGCYALGHGVGSTFYAPENNGILVLSEGESWTVAREASGYFGPSEKQLKMFDTLCGMTPRQIKDWAQTGFDPGGVQYRALCPECGEPLTVGLELVVDEDLYMNLDGQWQFAASFENASLRGIDIVHCTSCGEAWYDGKGVEPVQGALRGNNGT